MRRCIIFAHYDHDGLIDEHVVYMLSKLRPFTEQLIFVSVSATDEQCSRLDKICDIAVTRENIGYDFMSWKYGISYVNNINSLDEILFVNDSIYGPIFDLGSVFERSQKLQTPFWGLTKCHQIKPHIQSFFFAFRKPLIHEGVFDEFWGQVQPLDNKWDIIRNYEIGMTQFIESKGFQCGYIFDHFNLSWQARLKTALISGRRQGKSHIGSLRWYLKCKAANPMHAYCLAALNNGVPFLKVELLRDNPLKMSLEKIYKYLETTTYNPVLIKKHLNRISRDE